MSNGRIDFYTKVHKGLRARLFQLSQRAAATDYSDGQALAGLGTELRTLLAKLSAHGVHEARFIHPLLAEKIGSSPFDAAHRALEDEQAALQRLLAAVAQSSADGRRAQGDGFYRALNVFVAHYLRHIDEEERTMPLLWERCSDDELAGVMARFGAGRPLDEALEDIGWILPALSAPEQKELIGGMSAALGRR
jgi:iron-sulfur cluster repair protein YtfE (RIC family)